MVRTVPAPTGEGACLTDKETFCIHLLSSKNEQVNTLHICQRGDTVLLEAIQEIATSSLPGR